MKNLVAHTIRVLLIYVNGALLCSWITVAEARLYWLPVYCKGRSLENTQRRGGSTASKVTWWYSVFSPVDCVWNMKISKVLKDGIEKVSWMWILLFLNKWIWLSLNTAITTCHYNTQEKTSCPNGELNSDLSHPTLWIVLI